ncbi:GAF domain-containing protein [Noviherbaspirillum aerium]|uniref:GAF domain-containing protein n=1 Tax=Noviherbaspirillum aerium TaxID=2588497 RepID=UPI00124C93C8|nr:GAF domain-containing protein [Noviherbaspirillum aerium]
MNTPDRLAACLPIATHITYSGRFRTSNLRFNDEQFAHLHVVGEGSVCIVTDDETHPVTGPALVFCRPGIAHAVVVPEGACATMLCSAMLFDYGMNNPQLKTLPACLSIPLAEEASLTRGMPTPSLAADTPFSLATQRTVVEALFSTRISPRLAAVSKNGKPAGADSEPPQPPSAAPFPDAVLPRLGDFESSSREVLRYLRQRLDFDLFMITRTEGDDWTVLQCDDRRYGVSPGDVFRWSDSFCSHMVKGAGPRIAPNSDLIPAYATAPIGRQVHIKAYIGIPLLHDDGSLFGTLCAIHPSPKPATLAAEQALLEMLTGQLNRILSLELKAAAGTRRLEQQQLASRVDPATAAYTVEAWRTLLACEEIRCRRYGHPAAVLAVRIEPAGIENEASAGLAETCLTAAAAALRRKARDGDIVARTADRELALLAVECNKTKAASLETGMRAALDAEGIGASVSLSMLAPRSATLEAAN